MNTYSLLAKENKKILWGDFEGDSYYEDLHKYIEDKGSKSNDIELDFSGINSIDYSFINKVFIRLIDNFEINKGTHFIFKNIENDSIIYYLNQSFSKWNKSAYIKDNNGTIFIGINSCSI